MVIWTSTQMLSVGIQINPKLSIIDVSINLSKSIIKFKI